ncbi:MAG TPA: hypothetical protein VH274_07705, partial [Mycobacteriales bacterium]|nr:hypothetical protein [Mycobacteriales bacterium]
SFNNFGPEWQADTNLARQMPKEAEAQVYPTDDDVVRQPAALPSCPEGPIVHFDTPEAAMTYLAAAWNRNDLADLCRVTNPNSRFLLNDMHREAVNLRLKSCDRMDVGLYQCTFVHDYPKRMDRHGHGQTWLEVAAADNPGWYLLDYVGCG